MTSQSSPLQRALVTGGTGFIGSHLIPRLLKDGWEVHIITRPDSNTTVLSRSLAQVQCHVVDGSIDTMIQAVGASRPDIVFHLASLFLVQHKADDIGALVNSNILFGTQLLEAMHHHGIKRMINTSTSWQHYLNEDYNPVNLYAATKQAFESILEYYVEAHGFAVTTLALFDTYGPQDPRAKLIALLWKTAIEQQTLHMSPGEQLFDLVHVDDVIDAYVLAAKQLAEPVHKRYGISSGKPIALRELVSRFQAATGAHVPITWGGRPYRPREVMEPWSSYTPLPDWSPKIAFEDGIIGTKPW
jgi:nucleoside-diphosphate-sugar epimerase